MDLLLLDLFSRYNKVRIYLVIVYLLLLKPFTVARDIIVSTEASSKLDLVYFLLTSIIVFIVLT